MAKLFVGTYNHQLDQKNRFRIPAKLREQLGDNFVITKSVDSKCLYVFPAEKFEAMQEKIDSLPLFDAKAQNALRKFLSSCLFVEEDNQGRVMITPDMRKYANLQKDIVTIGVGTRLEIWSAEDWEKVNSEQATADEQEALTKYGI